jgi:D-galactose 1-dehydrogenase
MTVRIGIIGYGKIAADQHRPVIAAHPAFTLAAVSSHRAVDAGVPFHADYRDLLPHIDAVAICTPPGPRVDIARACIAAGKHVLLEKPLAASLSAAATLSPTPGRTLFAAWHSRFAPAVAPAKALLAGKRIDRVHIRWHEDVRRWHPGQDWVWAAGGFGVFDPGINALSIATEILPEPLVVRAAALDTPANRQTPIAARLDFGDRRTADFDWTGSGPQDWSIDIGFEGRSLRLEDGGARLTFDGTPQPLGPRTEYEALYDRFAALIASGTSDLDLRPLTLAADAFLIGERRTVAAFDW